MDVTCMHGMGWWHMIVDFWWAIAIFLSTPWFWLKR